MQFIQNCENKKKNIFQKGTRLNIDALINFFFFYLDNPENYSQKYDPLT